MGYFLGYSGNTKVQLVHNISPVAALICGTFLGIIGAKLRGWVMGTQKKDLIKHFLVDSLLAALGLVLGGTAGHFESRGYYGKGKDPVVETLAPFAAVVCGGVLGLVTASDTAPSQVRD